MKKHTSTGTHIPAERTGKPMELIKPSKLQAGDLVATVSLSWGGAGDSEFRWRYEQGKRRLIEEFGLRVIEMSNTLKGSQYLYEHPEARAADLREAFANPEIKAIFSCIGGEDSIRLLPHIDFDIIRANPKIFLGYSDSTITHLFCYKAGLTSFYGPSILAEFAENVQMFDYTAEYVRKTLFSSEQVGPIPAASEWTGERIEWLEENKDLTKTMHANSGYEFMQGTGRVCGQLIGGCMEVLEQAKGTVIWPDADTFAGAVFFLETAEGTPDPDSVLDWLRNYAAQGILHQVVAIVFGKPYQEKYYDEYREVIKTIVVENGLENLPIVYNMTFGHNQPMFILPYGCLAEIDCEAKTFNLLEAGVS